MDMRTPPQPALHVQPLPSDGAQTVAQAFAAAARAWPQQPFACVLPETADIYGIQPGEWSYAYLQQRIEALRAQYALAGYGSGHRVGLLLENRPAFFVHWFALNGLGVSVVPINADLRAAELEYLIGHSEIALAVALPERHASLRQAAHAAGRPLALMADGELPPVAPFAAPQPEAPLAEATECAVLYTSGTTGRPKGCILPNRYFLEAGRWYARIGGLAALRQGEERMLTPLPLVHMNAMAYSALAMVMTGGCLILLDRFHPRSWWDSVRASRATVVHYLGVMPAMLMKAEPSPLDRQHGVRFGFGAGVERSLHQPFESQSHLALIGVADGVVTQVQQDLRNAQRIAHQTDVLCTRRQHRFERHPFALGLGQHEAIHIIQQLLRIDGDVLQRQAARLHFRQVEQIIHHTQ